MTWAICINRIDITGVLCYKWLQICKFDKEDLYEKAIKRHCIAFGQYTFDDWIRRQIFL